MISRFTLRYLKTDILPRRYGALISNAALIRNRSNYEDFFICSIEDTHKLLEGAESFYNCIADYLNSRFVETNND